MGAEYEIAQSVAVIACGLLEDLGVNVLELFCHLLRHAVEGAEYEVFLPQGDFYSLALVNDGEVGKELLESQQIARLLLPFRSKLQSSGVCVCGELSRALALAEFYPFRHLGIVSL